MKKILVIVTLVLTTAISVFAQKIDKFSQEIIIDCEQGIEAAKMTSDGTIYGKAKGIDITFPFKTRINPDKGAEIKLEVPGYEEYKLVVPPGGIESNFMVIFTESTKEMAKSNKKEANTMMITIECDQFKTAKLVSGGGGLALTFSSLFSKNNHYNNHYNNHVMPHNYPGMNGVQQQHNSIAISTKQKKSKDVTFPYTTEIEIEKENKLCFEIPGYNVYELVIPKGNTQTNFKIYFTENPKEMAKLRKNNPNYGKSPDDVKSSTATQTTTTVSRDNPGKSAPEQTIIRWMVDSDPQGARIFYRVISSVPNEVQNTNEAYLLTTPYEETRAFNILGLTYENARNVQIEIKIMKPGYHPQVKRFNVRQALDQQEISTFFQLVKKEEE